MSQTVEKTILSLADIRTEIDQRLKRLYDHRVNAAAAIDPLYGQLLTEMRQFILRPSGGKRLRPYMTYLAYVGYGGKDTAAILDLAASQELFHNFLLIHDDIIDNDTIRYGGPNLTGRYLELLADRMDGQTARHYAEAVALLAGDINSGLAFEAILESSFDDGLKVAAAKRMTKMIFEIAGGELVDVLLPFEGESPTADRMLTVAHYKTASYSFSAPLQLGAILAGASQLELEKIDRVAIPLGICYQITDDILGMFGNEKSTGKPASSDLREGKQTILMQAGFELADSQQLKVLRQAFGNSRLSDRDHQTVKTILDKTGALEQTRALAEKYAARADLHQSELAWNPQALEVFSNLSAAIVGRPK